MFSLRKLRFYVAGRRFTIFTDHKALTHMLTQRKLNNMLERWLDEILDFSFDVVLLPGISNVLPDSLSRLYSASERPPVERLSVLFSRAGLAASDDILYGALAPPAGLPVTIWHDDGFLPFGVTVAHTSCWFGHGLVTRWEGVMIMGSRAPRLL